MAGGQNVGKSGRGDENCRGGGSGRGSKSGKMVGGSTKVVGGVKIRKMADGHRK